MGTFAENGCIYEAGRKKLGLGGGAAGYLEISEHGDMSLL